MAGQDQPEPFGPPTGVFLAQGLRVPDEIVGGTWPRGRRPIGRGGGLSAVGVAETEQVVDGAERQAELLGQGLRREAATACGQQGTADGEKNGAWHDTKLLSRSSHGEQATEH
jgi:hypothetical protein